jgi:hypothetical protein
MTSRVADGLVPGSTQTHTVTVTLATSADSAPTHSPLASTQLADRSTDSIATAAPSVGSSEFQSLETITPAQPVSVTTRLISADHTYISTEKPGLEPAQYPPTLNSPTSGSLTSTTYTHNKDTSTDKPIENTTTVNPPAISTAPSGETSPAQHPIRHDIPKRPWWMRYMSPARRGSFKDRNLWRVAWKRSGPDTSLHH